jgi:hypothetical protein
VQQGTQTLRRTFRHRVKNLQLLLPPIQPHAANTINRDLDSRCFPRLEVMVSIVVINQIVQRVNMHTEKQNWGFDIFATTAISIINAGL